MKEFDEKDYPPFQVAVHYMHKLLSDPSRVLEYVNSPDEAADLILSTLQSYGLPHDLDKDSILAAIPKKKFRNAKTIKWVFNEGTRDHIEAEIYDLRFFNKSNK